MVEKGRLVERSAVDVRPSRVPRAVWVMEIAAPLQGRRIFHISN